MRETPVRVQKLAKMEIVQIYCGEKNSFAVDVDGEILAWGNN